MSIRSKLAPKSLLERTYERMVVSERAMLSFNNSVDFTGDLSRLGGRARQIAEEIHNQVVPEVKGQGFVTWQAMKDATAKIRGFAGSMVRACQAHLDRQSTASVTEHFERARARSGDTKASLANLISDLNRYHTDVNKLMSRLNSEKLELGSENQKLENERKRLKQKLHDELHPHSASGYIRTGVSALTFQLEKDIRDAGEKMARQRAQYRANSHAIAGASHILNGVSNFRSQVEQQQTYWVNTQTDLGSVGQDLRDLQNDPGAADLEMELLKEDWDSFARRTVGAAVEDSFHAPNDTNYIYNAVLKPASPATVKFDEQIRCEFAYVVSERSYIWMQSCPGTWYESSQPYEKGSWGHTSRYVFVKKEEKDPRHINSLYIRIYKDDRSTLIYERKIPVDYRFE